MVRVGIFQVGYTRIDISKLCRLLNSAWNHYRFERATRIFTLGNPDIASYAYSDRSFFSIVSSYSKKYDMCIIITSVPIEDNFITRNLGYDLVIATSHQTEQLLVESHRSPEECAALGICGELVSIEFQRVTGEHWSKLFLSAAKAATKEKSSRKGAETQSIRKGFLWQFRLAKKQNNLGQNYLNFLDNSFTEVNEHL